MKIKAIVKTAVPVSLILVACLVVSCGKDDESPSGPIQIFPVAGFEASPMSGVAPLEVQFTDKSSGNPIGWQWDFGDGASSGAQNPKHTYYDTGQYSVSLIVANAVGSDTAANALVISVVEASACSFTADKVIGRIGLTVHFTDQSVGNITSWSWDFGDEGTSTEQNPTHQYNAEGVYTVTLSVDGTTGPCTETKPHYITVDDCYGVAGPSADFSRSPASGPHNLTVSFTDLSSAAADKNIVSWQWNFGDGGTSPVQNPTHTYTACGNFNVSLTVTDNCGRTGSKTCPSCVSVYAQTQNVPVSPGTKGPYWPTKIEGDCEFDGHGPNVTATVTLLTKNSDRDLYARIYMKARETVSNWSTAEGSWDVPLYSAPTGWKISGFSPSSCSDVYTDTDHAYHVKNCALCTIRTIGDTGGNDICNTTMDDTHIIVDFNTINVTIVEIDCK